MKLSEITMAQLNEARSRALWVYEWPETVRNSEHVLRMGLEQWDGLLLSDRRGRDMLNAGMSHNQGLLLAWWQEHPAELRRLFEAAGMALEEEGK